MKKFAVTLKPDTPFDPLKTRQRLLVPALSRADAEAQVRVHLSQNPPGWEIESVEEVS